MFHQLDCESAETDFDVARDNRLYSTAAEG
jgi:hypothetical protein